MKNASGKSPVLASHPGAHQTDGQIGILVSPADKAVIETVDAIEIAPRHREVAGLGAAPTLLLQFAQWTQRQTQRRQQAINAAAQTPAQETAERPHLRRERLRQNGCSQLTR